jgi:hypothetical protein
MTPIIIERLSIILARKDYLDQYIYLIMHKYTEPKISIICQKLESDLERDLEIVWQRKSAQNNYGEVWKIRYFGKKEIRQQLKSLHQQYQRDLKISQII